MILPNAVDHNVPYDQQHQPSPPPLQTIMERPRIPSITTAVPPQPTTPLVTIAAPVHYQQQQQQFQQQHPPPIAITPLMETSITSNAPSTSSASYMQAGGADMPAKPDNKVRSYTVLASPTAAPPARTVM